MSWETMIAGGVCNDASHPPPPTPNPPPLFSAVCCCAAWDPAIRPNLAFSNSSSESSPPYGAAEGRRA